MIGLLRTELKVCGALQERYLTLLDSLSDFEDYAHSLNQDVPGVSGAVDLAEACKGLLRERLGDLNRSIEAIHRKLERAVEGVD